MLATGASSILLFAGCGDTVPSEPLQEDQHLVGGAAPSASGGDSLVLAGARLLPITTLEEGQTGPWRDAGVTVFFSAEEWISTMLRWAREGRLLVLPPPPPPEGFDWRHNIVILTTSGEYITSPSYIELREARYDGRSLLLQIDVGLPGDLQNFSSPYHLVSVSRRGLGAPIQIKPVYHCYPWPWVH